MKLSKYDLGTTDAKNSLLSGEPGETGVFLASFVEPENLQLDKFIQRKKYFVTGLKGIGKTALLRYIAYKMESDDSQSIFILFKSEINENLRKNFSSAARLQIVEDNLAQSDSNDYENVWRWLIYKKIAQSIENNLAEPFQRTQMLDQFLALLRSEKQESWSGLKKIIPSVKKGQIEISKDPKLSFDFNWDSEGNAKVKFSKLVEMADDLFEQLPSSTGRLNLFFDELEVTYSNSKQHERDAALIRDLIVSIEKINATAKKLGYPICLYAAIRSEVLKSVKTLGKEINKPVTDFGTNISWSQSKDELDHPLLRVIERRINASRSELGMEQLASADLWNSLFPEKIDGRDPREYLLHVSWYRPRDMSQIMLIAQDQHPNETCFSAKVLKSIRKEYASASWTELTEELSTSYKDQELESLRHLLFGFKQIFTISELDTHAQQRAIDYPGVRALLDAHELRKIVADLYRIGLIGNHISKNRTFRFAFRGDPDVIYGECLYIHNALRSLLSI